MPAIFHFQDQIKKLGFKNKALYAMGFLILFWTLFDGILQYVVPLIITGEGISKTMMGIIIGTSSIAGLFFDLILCKVFKKANLRRTYIVLFAICLIYPLILWKATVVWAYILAMAVWGLYYDLFNIGRYEFVGEYIKEDQHASSFGVLSVFVSLGYLLSPIFAGLLISEVLDFKPFLASWIFLFLALIFFMLLLFLLKKQKKLSVESETITNIYERIKKTKLKKYSEFYIWKRISILIFPVLLITIAINIIDSVFTEIGPLVVEGWLNYGILSSLFLVGYLLPFIFVGWFVGLFTSKFGKKKTAIYSLFLSSLFLVPFLVISNPIILIICALFCGFFLALCDPSNRATYADYVSETKDFELEIESQADFATNFGYVIGPILAGLFADKFGDLYAFGIIGIIGLIIAIILFFITPKEINISIEKDNKSDFIKNKV
jgi:MFS family permease